MGLQRVPQWALAIGVLHWGQLQWELPTQECKFGQLGLLWALRKGGCWWGPAQVLMRPLLGQSLEIVTGNQMR